MEISEQIDRILEKRASKLPDIEAKLTLLDDMRREIAYIEALRSEMITIDGQIKEDGRFSSMLNANPDMAWTLKDLKFNGIYADIEAAADKLKDYYDRCNRPRVNISVVGMARIGKSELLKAISGLSNYVIPAFDSSDCTGAPSIINNAPGTTLEAKLTFKKPDTLRQMAQKYLDDLVPDLGRRPLLRSMEEIKSLSIPEIREAIPKGSSKAILLPYLEKMVNHYDEWAHLAGGSPCVLNDETVIMTFVAQNNGVEGGKEGREEYFKYLAVDSCVISCEFPQSEVGKISLIDTVGLGDHTAGILDSMLETIRTQSDAVVFVHNPRDGSGGGFPQPVADVYDGIHEACKDKDLEKWLYYLINHVTKPTKKMAVNTEFCNAALKTLQDANYSGASNAKIIDVMDTGAVRTQFLLPMLEGIAENLDSIDEIYRVPAEQSLQRLRNSYSVLCATARKALQSDIKRDSSLMPLILESTKKCKTAIRSSLFHLEEDWRRRKDQPCERVDRYAQDIFRRMSNQYDSDTFLPSMDMLREDLETGETASTLYQKYADSIRNKITNAFLDMDLELDSLINGMKGDVAVALYDACGFGKLCAPPQDGRQPCEWLLDFSEMVLGNDQAYPNIKLAMDTLANFRFSVKAFLTYEVRNCLDDLDSHYSNVPPLLSGRNADSEQTARNLFFALYQTASRIASDLEDRMRDVFIRPNRAIAAELMDFLDRIYYADGSKEEWDNLLAMNSGLLWADQIRDRQIVDVLCEEWLDAVERLQKYNQASKYQI